jgi:hypothetical protein
MTTPVIPSEVEGSLESIPLLPPSDFVPGISPNAIDYDWAVSEIERLQAKLADLQPCVIRIGGVFNLYQNAQVRVQTPSAQLMWDYLATNVRTTVRWFILPQQPPLNPS